MFETSGMLREQMIGMGESRQADLRSFAVRKAAQLFEEMHLTGRLAGLARRLTGRSARLLDLNEIERTNPVRSRHYAGLQSVRLDAIIGSEGRADDFDAAFRPLKENTKGRWTSIAMAELQGQGLPAVELIEVGGRYFVRDGHHRISVAQAFGREEIDADVTVIELACPLPWEGAPCCVPALARA
jgi:uncharacterized ParB-like nuclease family protein